MLRMLAISSLGGAIALLLAAFTASAAPGVPGPVQAHSIQGGAITLARMGHMSMGHIGSVHMGPRFYGARIGHGPGFYARSFRHHRHNRFFFVGVPYYYGDYYYDDAYDGCWWSRRYHRWVCSGY